jgi:DNA-binding protein
MSDAGHGPAYITSRGRAIGNAVDKIEAVKTRTYLSAFPGSVAIFVRNQVRRSA